MTSTIESPVLFYLAEDKASQPPSLISEIHSLARNQFPCHMLIGEKADRKTRAGSGELLIQRVNPAGVAILVEYYASYACKFGKTPNDLPYMIRVLETSSQHLDGIFVQIPYIELRDDRKFRDAEPMVDFTADILAAKDTQNKVIGFALWDPHSSLSVDKFWETFARRKRKIKLHCFTALPLFAKKFRETLDIDSHPEDYIVVAPDLGSLHRSMLLANELGLPIALFDKTRPDVGDVEFGDLFVRDEKTGFATKASTEILKGKKALFFDDMYATTKTAVKGAERLKQKYGIAEAHFAATHPAYIMPEALEYLGEALKNKTIDSAYVTNTLPTCNLIPGVQVLSLAEPMTKVMKVVGGLATKEDYDSLDEYYYHPGPTKEVLKSILKDGQLDLTPEKWLWLHPPDKIPFTGVIYFYWRGRDYWCGRE